MSTATINRSYLSQEPATRPVVELGAQHAHSNAQRDASVDEPIEHDDRLLNARQVAAKLGVSERWVRDHTTRRSPKIRGVKLGTLMRYRRADVEVFMQELDTLPSSRRPRIGV